jgi:hypothetical protein
LYQPWLIHSGRYWCQTLDHDWGHPL